MGLLVLSRTRLPLLIAVLAGGCGGGGGLHLDMGSSTTPDLTAAASNPDLSSTMGNPDLATAPTACDIVKQSGCPNAAMSKCTITTDATMTLLTVACAETNGTKTEGMACTRTHTGAAGIGHDDCAKGLYCSPVGAADAVPSRFCRKLCVADANCTTAKTRCADVTRDPNNPAGVCAPLCTFLGTDCATGFTCSAVVAAIDGQSFLPTCRAIGKSAIGATCKASIECIANALCFDPQQTGTGKCTAFCDTTHTCPTGTSCMMPSMPPLPNMGGVCQ